MAKFMRTGEFRIPKDGELYMNKEGNIVVAKDGSAPESYIYRQVPEDPTAAELLVSVKALVEEIKVLRAKEAKPTLAASPKSGVEYAGIDPTDSPAMKQAAAIIARHEAARAAQ